MNSKRIHAEYFTLPSRLVIYLHFAFLVQAFMLPANPAFAQARIIARQQQVIDSLNRVLSSQKAESMQALKVKFDSLRKKKFIIDTLLQTVYMQHGLIDQEEESIRMSQLAFESKENKYIFSLIATFIMLLLIFAAILYYILKQNQRKSELILKQKKLVEENQKEMVDSINYAQRIQKALLKEEERVTMHLPDHFILYMPKDAVSGDFYWALDRDGYFYIAAVDCTGHGVPGGFMSMLGVAFLNEITAGSNTLSPNIILNKLRDKVLKELGKTGETKDGMDISLMRMNLSTRKIQWSGANNSLYLIKNEIKVIPADKQPIGYYPAMKPFTNHIIAAEPDSMYYLYSDGYASQFGGPRGRKFMSTQLKKLLLSIHQKPLQEQKQILRETFLKWKGKLEQVDDVLIIGVKV
jgi:serine phosphatase RsbU (regulator of sigma subunit)